MKIYIVTSGTYSYYGINAVFSSTEKAEEYLAQMPAKEREEGYYKIEEWGVDELPPLVYGPEWAIRLRLDGSIAEDKYYPEHDKTEDHYKGERGRVFRHPAFDRPNDDMAKIDSMDGLFWGYSYISRDHAMKLAIEERQQAIREHPERFTVASREKEHG